MIARTIETNLIPPDTDRQVLESRVAPRARAMPSIWLFPGLGCRHVGMGYDILGRDEVADRLVASAESFLGYDVKEVCLEGSGRKHVSPRTEAQVIYVVDCAYAAVLESRGYTPSVISGHSLGNWAAACVAGAYDFLTGLALVTDVESLLEELIDGRNQGMGVVIGLDEATVASRGASAGGTSIANWNSPGQYVISGAASGVDSVVEAALARGAKQARRLPGQRALHTPNLEELTARLCNRLSTVHWVDPRVTLVGSHDGRILQTADDVCGYLADFLRLPVRWDLTVQALRHWDGNFVEVGPGNVLLSMLPFIDRSAVGVAASELLEQEPGL